MQRRRIRRTHFAFTRIVEVPAVAVAIPVPSSLPYWITAGISKVYGGGPDLSDEPIMPIASTVRAARKPNKGWQKFQAMLNGAADHIRGYDDGEWEPQMRGIHV